MALSSCSPQIIHSPLISPHYYTGKKSINRLKIQTLKPSYVTEIQPCMHMNTIAFHHSFNPAMALHVFFLREIISYNPTNVYRNPHSTIHEENLISSFPRNTTNLDFGDSFATDPPHYYPLVFVPLEFYQQLLVNPISYQHLYHNKPMQCSKAYISLPHYFY